MISKTIGYNGVHDIFRHTHMGKHTKIWTNPGETCSGITYITYVDMEHKQSPMSRDGERMWHPSSSLVREPGKTKVLHGHPWLPGYHPLLVHKHGWFQAELDPLHHCIVSIVHS